MLNHLHRKTFLGDRFGIFQILLLDATFMLDDTLVQTGGISLNPTQDSNRAQEQFLQPHNLSFCMTILEAEEEHRRDLEGPTACAGKKKVSSHTFTMPCSTRSANTSPTPFDETRWSGFWVLPTPKRRTLHNSRRSKCSARSDLQLE